MLTIHYKSGKTQLISQEIGDILAKKIVEGCSNFQVFTEDETKLKLLINLSEIEFIS